MAKARQGERPETQIPFPLFAAGDVDAVESEFGHGRTPWAAPRTRFFAKAFPEPDLKYLSSARAVTSSGTAT
jgi:hypothetical protein